MLPMENALGNKSNMSSGGMTHSCFVDVEVMLGGMLRMSVINANMESSMPT